jgi:hypothetical protein
MRLDCGELGESFAFADTKGTVGGSNKVSLAYLGELRSPWHICEFHSQNAREHQ